MLPANVRIFVCTAPQDMRRGFDRLALAARRATGVDPRNGDAIFCFVNRRRSLMKVLWCDGTGSCIFYKRLSSALFDVRHDEGGPTSLVIDSPRFVDLIRGVITSRGRSKRTRRRL